MITRDFSVFNYIRHITYPDQDGIASQTQLDLLRVVAFLSNLIMMQKWHFPTELSDDLHTVDLPKETKQEILACAYQYARCVIPEYTNWGRYIAFVRLVVVAAIAEFRGDLIDILSSNTVVGYNIDELLSSLFKETPYQYVETFFPQPHH